MPRIAPVDIDQAAPEARDFLDGVRAKFGRTPNFFTTIAHAPETAAAFAAFNGALAGTRLTAAEREAIAISQAGYHGCPYCAAAHTAIAAGAGVPAEEAAANLAGTSAEPKIQALVAFARAVLQRRGRVSEADIAAVKAEGYDEGHIIETIAVVAANTFTNFVNIVAATEVDFPQVTLPEQPAAA